MGILKIGQRVNGKSSTAADICSATDGNSTVVILYRNADAAAGFKIIGQTPGRFRIGFNRIGAVKFFVNIFTYIPQ